MNREEFKEKAKGVIDDIFVKIDELEEKKENFEGEAKEKYEEKLKELEEKKEELEKKYKDLEEGAEGKWEEVKESFSKSADFFRQGIKDLMNIFNKDGEDK